MTAPVEFEEMGDREPISPNLLERTCEALSLAALAVMLVIVAVDIFTRTIFNHSFQVAEEIAAYMLAALTFMSLAVTQVNDGFHRVNLVLAQLTSRGRLLMRILFDILSIAVACILLWVFLNFVYSSWRFGTVAPTTLATPRWIAQLPMVLGVATFILALIHTLLARWRIWRNLPGN
jgi:TRAP-type C4-dicarboxylate transport system permease small subunit